MRELEGKEERLRKKTFDCRKEPEPEPKPTVTVYWFDIFDVLHVRLAFRGGNRYSTGGRLTA
jgi:hypothetical protein